MSTDACDSEWAESLKALREALRRDGRLVLKPTGRSMGRLYAESDAIVIEPPPARPAPCGSIVVFPRGDQWVAHRIVAGFCGTDDVAYITCGDGAGRLDGDLVTHRNLIGIVTEVRAPGGAVNLRSRQQRMLGRLRAARSLTAALLRHPIGTAERLVDCLMRGRPRI